MAETNQYEKLTPKEIGKLCFKERKELKLSQAQVAKMAGTSQPEVSKFEKGKKVSRDVEDGIVRALKIKCYLTLPREYE